MKISRTISQTFLLSLVAFMGLLYASTRENSMQEAYLTLATLGLICLSLVLERFRPLHREWNEGNGDTAGDIGSLIVIFGILDSALKWLSPFIILALLPETGSVLSLPLWSQIIIAALLIEFGAWVSHWAHHRFTPLWNLHAMHHSSGRLYTLNNFRFHPFNHVINHLVMFVPPLAIGIAPEAILGYVALSTPVLLFQHTNLNFNFGWLNYIFNTNALHRWHHSAEQREGMNNLGRSLVIWDHVFGTFFYPHERSEPEKIGLFKGHTIYPSANKTIMQLLWPFNTQCCR